MEEKTIKKVKIEDAPDATSFELEKAEEEELERFYSEDEEDEELEF